MRKEKTKREDGQYWVKFMGNWEVAFCLEGTWFIAGDNDEFIDKEFDEILEQKLLPPKET